jgi:NADH-quinone oxidoreductase subunit J
MNDFLQTYWIDVVTLATLVLAAAWAVLSPRLLRAVIGLALASVCVTILLFRLDSPLAAVFELSVCAGLISAVFISTVSLSQLETEESIKAAQQERIRRYWYLPPLLLLVGVATLGLDLQSLPEVSAVGKDVRQVLWTERPLDLLGQVTVLLAGAFGVVVLFKEAKKHER